MAWGIDRKIRPEDHYPALQGLSSDARLWSRGTDFLSPLTPGHDRCFFFHLSFLNVDFFFFVIMQSLRLLTSAVIVMTLLWRLMTSLLSGVYLNDGTHYNQCISNMREFSIFILPWVGWHWKGKNFYPRVKSRISLSGVQEMVCLPLKNRDNAYSPAETRLALRKHSYLIILRILPPKNKNFQMKKFW